MHYFIFAMNVFMCYCSFLSNIDYMHQKLFSVLCCTVTREIVLHRKNAIEPNVDLALYKQHTFDQKYNVI
jgi:hypothetical protein